ncbi:hypothetical protein RDV84_23150 [Lysobacter yananisis]|uniref:Uncharacterized protein n=1 Tax=Lysobacter yananisis TaxID=1003114 RepID=A0ABY9P6Z1_9GAMM|nr:hypothetical protein [Lysobacter yananisis]WMT02825.1 hypothetical protein RDV84_23150 [Lysobacter yananisis]
MRKHLDAFFGALALCGFAASLIVHLRTFWGYTLDLPGGVHLLPLALPVVFAPLVLQTYRTPPEQRNIVGLPGELPWWAIAVLIAVFVYAGLNFLVSVVSNGSPEVSDGRYVLQEHGRVIREITAQQYREAVVRQVRGFSGHMLPFYLMPAIWFLVAKKA